MSKVPYYQKSIFCLLKEKLWKTTAYKRKKNKHKKRKLSELIEDVECERGIMKDEKDSGDKQRC